MNSIDSRIDSPGGCGPETADASVAVASPVAQPRKISAVRDFPIGPRRSDEELRRLIDFSKRYTAKIQSSTSLNLFPTNPPTAAAEMKIQPRKRPAEASDSGDRRIRSSRNRDIRSTVLETLRLFGETCDRLLRENPNPGRGKRNRVDYKASRILKNRWVNTGEKIVGSVPGVEVGDVFRYRMELCMVGLHRRNMSGIDFKRLSIGGHDVLATCIVSSGYYDDRDVDDVFIYCGQGGDPKNPCGNRVASDQTFTGGNLALKRSMEREKPVRVVRGFHGTTSWERGVSTYIYDGLYVVERCWEELGSSGYIVLKFQLRRMPGQPMLRRN
ncbi:Histone-lysine N-methyltransferase, H3 lysine-9 specific SUVH5 [Acorus gramineus]|uniref:Histone-lysine N-methyltransferase, H3 lysine-9 specific SUVH5 n=1 Tax=Acorus gramineus TaxID=55184 RepID=A0AAV9ARQ9_ACOGR|nr:Histone-lysine N-methyltransferase, H3 lysine-9 specific SUVH5 [Acorus gramineus]